nr:PilZ domain-containing protein [Chromobacterium sphagni]
MDAANTRQDLNNPNRPGVLSLHIKERSALFAAYMPFARNGGIFIPTNKEMQLGEEVFLLLTLMEDPQRIAVQAKVVWITPAGANNSRVQGWAWSSSPARPASRPRTRSRRCWAACSIPAGPPIPCRRRAAESNAVGVVSLQGSL